MRILGIDPNAETAAWVLYDTAERRVLAHGTKPWLDLVHAIQGGYKWGELMDPDAYVVERLQSYLLRVQTTTFDAQWNGACLWLAADERRNRCDGPQAACSYWITRPQIKLQLLGRVAANDADVRGAIIDMHGGSRRAAFGVKADPGPLYGVVSHEMQALAVAIAWAMKEGGMDG